jgi:ABC-type sugar transport system permease subunit
MNGARFRISLETKRKYSGLWFILPWFIGFLFLFAVPFLQSFHYSIGALKLTDTGFTIDYIGFANYYNAFYQHGTFVRRLTESVINMCVNVPLIVVFSLFSAVLLNQKFRGRGLARAIFFLPVILASGVIAGLESGDYMQSVMKDASAEIGGSFSIVSQFDLAGILIDAGVSPAIVGYLSGAVIRIYQIISQSGVQILIFLAGLQSISPSLYEASKIEGATAYEAFWKITFPMISPLILTNVVYSVIDNFMNNQTSKLIIDTAFRNFQFGLSAAMAIVYFAVISVILWIMTFLISKKVFYHD